MKLILLICNILIATGIGCNFVKRAAPVEVTYVAAVIEFEPYDQWTDTDQGFGVIRQNALTIKDYAAQAKLQSADILVTPEYGLQSLDMFPEDLNKFLTYTQYVPDPEQKLIPYRMDINNTNFEGMQILSSAAMENEMYLVIDMGEVEPCSEETVPLAPWPVQPDANCSASGYFFYNTQVVFDRNGIVIARYRKQNLYGEDYYTPGPRNDTRALFLTDFDVLFTLQICFDIEFEHPALTNVKTLGIKDVATSTAWVDALPFDLADNSFNSWSRGLGVNVLTSGYHRPEEGKLGSGIFRGYSQELPVYIYDKHSGNVLLISEIKTIAASSINFLNSAPYYEDVKNTLPKSRSFINEIYSKPILKTKVSVEDEERVHQIVYNDLSNYTRETLIKSQPGESLVVNACNDNEFCCRLEYEYSGNLTYMFMVYSGQFMTTSDDQIGIQICSVVWCKNDDYNTCARIQEGLPDDDSFGPFTISSSSFAIDSIYPGGNHRDMSLISNDVLQFDINGKNFTLSANEPIVNHLMAALYGKWYSHNGGRLFL